MRYVSTRGESSAVSFEGAILNGLAPDGGLYVPETWPHVSAETIRSFRNRSYEEIAFEIVSRFIEDEIPSSELKSLISAAYGQFDSKDPAPLTPLGQNKWQLELYHGPTYAFKDYALQLLVRLQDYFLKRSGRKTAILTATSGDTGAAAIEACRGLKTVEIFVLHPLGRISELHRRLMTTVDDRNVHNIAIDGTFDDCQALVKAAFSDQVFRDRYNLSTLNSINWGRVVGQIAYYFSSAAKLGAPDVAPIYSVPTGNFGDVYSGYAAHRMGLPISRLVVATNDNDILHRFFGKDTGVYSREGVSKTELTPCMDIQAPSNFERVLFDLYDHDASVIRQKMQEFNSNNQFCVDQNVFARAREIFSSESAKEHQTLETIKSVYEDYCVIVDPHTAVGIWAVKQLNSIKNIDVPVVYLATSHPAKSQEGVKCALGSIQADVPLRLKQIEGMSEHFEPLPNSVEVLTRYVGSVLDAGSKRSVAAE